MPLNAVVTKSKHSGVFRKLPQKPFSSRSTKILTKSKEDGHASICFPIAIVMKIHFGLPLIKDFDFLIVFKLYPLINQQIRTQKTNI